LGRAGAADARGAAADHPARGRCPQRGLPSRLRAQGGELLEAEIQPWLGKWQDLREVYARYQKGEVTQEQGAEEIQARVAAAALAEDTGDVRHRRDNQHSPGAKASQAEKARRNGVGKRTQERLDAIARKKPDLLQAVAAGMPVREAARLAGVEPKPDAGKQLRKWWAAASPEQRAAFEDYIAAWHRKEAA
jgi:hypothetical protein